MISKPQLNEYAPFSANYVKLVGDSDVIPLLEKLKGQSYDLFSNLSEEKGSYAYADGKWTIKECIGHMIDAERTFAYRLHYFSRQTVELPGFDQDIFVNNAHFNDSTVQDLATEFRAARESNLFMIRALTDEQIDRAGIASGYRVSVRGLIYIMAGHELHHHIIFREKYGIS